MTDIPRAPGPPEPPTDEALLAASLGEPELFAQIFDRHAGALHRYLSRRVGDLADDLLSEAFLVAFRRRCDYRPERTDVRPWLYGIAANLLRHHVRQEVARYRALTRVAARSEVASPDGRHDADAAAQRVDAEGMRVDLAAALADLEPGDREVLLLAAWAELTYAEIAVALGIPVGTVRSRLHRARRRVQEHLAGTGRSRPARRPDGAAQPTSPSAPLLSLRENR
ncbi:sigma-70 family RNA polymerase sigma factor [Micromonospora coxensis]|uniref:RNA polymerase sigma factor n=1 Tax=Micromonospora coxensis TaxID=356852 RepID=UPI0034256B02